jgi:4'-phosphopantetheinyl transferase
MNYAPTAAAETSPWQPPPEGLVLPAGACHVWRLAIGSMPALGALGVLDAAERERAARFVFERDRVRYLAAHVGMRHILARYLGAAPAELAFSEGLHGRPQLAGAWAGDLEFNLSHSGELALVAVTLHGPLGVDVEALRPMPDWRELAERYFTPEECAALVAAGADPQVEFLRCWVRKEAALKSTGIGLSEEPRDVSVGVGPLAAQLWVRAALAPAEARTEVRVVSIGLQAAAVGACATAPLVRVTQCFECPLQW